MRRGPFQRYICDDEMEDYRLQEIEARADRATSSSPYYQPDTDDDTDTDDEEGDNDAAR